MNDFEEEEEIELPRFECRLPIPDEITGGDRMLLQQVDILRQEIAFVHKRGVLGRRAWVISKGNQEEINKLRNKLNKAYWMTIGAIAALEVVLRLMHL